MSREVQTVYAADAPSRMVVVGVERRPDGVLVVHAPAPEGQPPQTFTASDPRELWQAVQGVLNDTSLPQLTVDTPESVSLEQALGAMAGDLLGNFLRTRVPTAAPHIQRAATQATTHVARKAGGLAASLGKADVPIRRYPRGS